MADPARRHQIQTQNHTDMAGITKRGNMWYAVYKLHGKQIRQRTGIAVKGQPGATPKQAEKLARQAADIMERNAKGETTLSQAVDALRAAAQAQGAGDCVPSVREYLATVRERKQDRSNANRERAHNLFVEFLGKAADMRLDLVTRQQCREFVRWLAAGGRVCMETALRHKSTISAAFNMAVEEDDYLQKNPMRRINVREEYIATAGAAAAVSLKREPFTPEEMRRLLTEAPAPWCDMVAVSWYCAGLRISDVALMRWDSVDLAAGVVHIAAEVKTQQERVIPICPDFHARLESIRARQVAAGDGDSAFLFPSMAAQYEVNKSTAISGRFTALLRAMGIVTDTMAAAKQGNRHRQSPKSFHSIRHAVVSILRSNAAFTPDMVRDAVGHSSEQVERGYYTGTMKQRARLADALAAAVSDAPPAPALPPYPATA